MQLDFSAFMARLGRSIEIELQEKMYAQTGVDRAQYGKLKPETIRQKRKISQETADLRMIRTKDFVNNAFAFVPVPNGVRVFISSAKHGRVLKALSRTLAKYKAQGLKAKIKSQAFKVARTSVAAPSYKEIASWQLSPKSEFFPRTADEVYGLQVVNEGFQEFAEEADAQIRDMAEIHFSEILNV